MNIDSPQRKARNRRFLLSIWHRPRADASAKFDGVIWEADPIDPGKIEEPTRFETLSSLPGILDRFLSNVDHEDTGEGL